jgi:predicted transcriptional regulator
MKSLKQHIAEGRPSQRHPLEGHEYHRKTDAQLEYIAKDAHKAAEAMKDHNTAAENKYRDQANDSATVRYFRKKNGMPEWYKKKYGHMKEEVEQVDEAKLVGILRHAEHGKAYIWQKPGEGGYNYEVEHAKSKKKEQHNKSHEDVVADLKSRGYKMNEEVEVNEQSDDEHFSKQSQKMKDAINLHLRKGKDYKGAVEAAKKHVNESSYQGKGNHKPGWMLRADPKLAKKFKDVKKIHKAKEAAMGKPSAGISKSKVTEDWQDVNRKDKTDGLSQAAVNAYRRENPGSKLQTAVTEKKPTGKRAKRRLSFCRRMKGMKSKLTSAKTSRDPDSRINKALRRWNC